jgi:branched-chain amino acid transport system ATP-binding protein
VLLVEQNPLVALSVADRVYVMDKGSVVHQGAARELLQDATLRQKLLGV